MKTRSQFEGRDPHDISSSNPLVVELIGLAGAGKTSITRALQQRDARMYVADDIKLRKRQHLSVFASQTPFMMSLFLPPAWTGRRPTWNELKTMVYLHKWPHVLYNEMPYGCTTILLDHGPIFKLATLYAFGPDYLHTPAFAPWWHKMFELWANILDFGIWLHAPYEVLFNRINLRSQKHAVKGSAEPDAIRFLQRYEAAYRHILGHLAMHTGPLLIQSDTYGSSVDQVADEILAVCRTRHIHGHATQEQVSTI